MKKMFILMAFFLTGCGAVNVSAMNPTTEYPSPQPTATISPVPTATIGYQATANVAETQVAIAQATADEANRVMVQATNDEKQREHERAIVDAQGTQQESANQMVRESWTATAALTAVPLTSTAQVDNSTAISAQTTLTTSLITSTAELPTQIVAVAKAKADAQYAPVYMGVQIFAIFAVGVFLFFTASFMRWYWMREDKRAAEAAHAQSPQGIAERHGFTPVAIVSDPAPEVEFIQPVDAVPVAPKNNMYTLPCTKEMLLQFAENVLTKNWTLGINAWERDDTLFTRDTYKPFRSWLLSNRFAASTGGGALALTENGRVFLEGFLNTSALPTEYQFGEVTA